MMTLLHLQQMSLGLCLCLSSAVLLCFVMFFFGNVSMPCHLKKRLNPLLRDVFILVHEYIAEVA